MATFWRDEKALADAFHFLTFGYYARLYPARRRKRKGCLSGNYLVHCQDCGRPMRRKVAILRYTRTGKYNTPYQCRLCFESEKREREERMQRMARHENTRRSLDLIERFSDALHHCDTYGVCDIIAAHHATLDDDPERLTTSFLVNLITRRIIDRLERKGRS